jgi:Zn-dependent protease with chaperone function
LIPAALLAPSSRQVLLSVVAHELAHVQRRDLNSLR